MRFKHKTTKDGKRASKEPLNHILKNNVLEVEGRKCKVLCGDVEMERRKDKLRIRPKSAVAVVEVDGRFHVYFHDWCWWHDARRVINSTILRLSTYKCKNRLCGERVRIVYGDAKVVENLVDTSRYIQYYNVSVKPLSEPVVVEHNIYDYEVDPKYEYYNYYIYCKERWIRV